MTLPDHICIELYRTMVRCRYFEETVQKLKPKLKGFLHLSIGQEAVAAGLSAALRQHDILVGHHRNHSHAIAKGIPIKNIMAELYGKVTGCCRGFGGSMHIGSMEHGVFPSNAILGANVVISAGLALATKMKKTDQVIACVLGDGAMNTGAVHEGFNLAAVWDLPVVFVCENNLYAISTHIKRTTRIENLADRANAYGMPGMVVDGMDAEAVYNAASKLIQRARDGEGPSLLECKTYRFCGSFAGEIETYRTKEEVEEWRKKDPLKLGQKLVEEGILTQEMLKKIEQEAKEEIQEAIRFAEESPEPNPETITENIFAPEPTIPKHIMVEPPPGDRVLSISEALNEALLQAMERDPSVFVLGEDIGIRGGEFLVTKGFYDKFGPERVRDTPISESAIIGASIGAAIQGFRPVAEIMFNDFLGVAFDQLLNQASKLRYMSGGQVKIPMVVRTAYGAGLFAAAQHEQSLEALFVHIPGIKIAMPTTAYDAKGLLMYAILDDNPVLFFEHKLLYNEKDAVPETEYVIPFGKARIRHPGKDVTVVAIGRMVNEALKAASILEQEGISIEVIDPRTLVPFDTTTVLNSVKKTHRLVIVHEAWKRQGFGAEVAAIVAETAFNELKAPIKRIAGLDCPSPFAPNLAPRVIPNHQTIIQSIKEMLHR
ncbi:MAG: alpha-ketoacid dehydrogenase subunit alpha/beta [Candidatus Asgardarchaeia archaeon]